MEAGDQNKKHVVADKAQQKKMEGETHKPGDKKTSKSWWDKLMNLFN